jgi:hypothetical protein
MAKGYPIGLPLQTKGVAKSSVRQRCEIHIRPANCGEMAVVVPNKPRTQSPFAHNEFNGAA